VARMSNLLVGGLFVVAGCSTSATTATSETVSATDQSSTVTISSPTTPPELNPFGGNDPEDHLMPAVVCMSLQEAQDEIQDHGVFLSLSEDATGQGRSQLIDSNWQVVAQSPDVGATIGEGDAVLQVVKYGEQPNPC